MHTMYMHIIEKFLPDWVRLLVLSIGAKYYKNL